MIQIHKLSLHFGSQTVFNEINATINANDRVGLVGRNGTGKSTLLQIIAKKQDIDGEQYPFKRIQQSHICPKTLY